MKLTNHRIKGKSALFNVWSSISDQACKTSNEEHQSRLCIVFHHGAGYTAQTWSLACSRLLELHDRESGSEESLDFDIISFDARSHGQTTLIDHDSDCEMSLTVLARDLWDCVEATCCELSSVAQQPSCVQQFEFILVGHSLGGAVVVEAARLNQLEHRYKVAGIVVVDVVEGSALESLVHMNWLLSNRKSQFLSHGEAIQYAVTSGMTRNIEAARSSVPSQLAQRHYPDNSVCFEWITDLSRTEPFWEGIFHQSIAILRHC